MSCAAYRSAATLLLLTVICAPRPAHARWDDTRDTVLGTAHTLEQGTFSIGVFAPLQYGATDAVMIATHPVLDLLLTPNIHTRVRLYDGVVAVGLQVGYQQTFLGEREGGFPGNVHTTAVLSVPIGWRVSLTAHTGYAWSFFPTDHRVLGSFGVHVLLTHADMLMAQVAGAYSAHREDWDRPSGTLLYAHAWTTFHLGVGVAVGQFPFVPWEDTPVELGGVPIYPVIDAWWRL